MGSLRFEGARAASVLPGLTGLQQIVGVRVGGTATGETDRHRRTSWKGLPGGVAAKRAVMSPSRPRREDLRQGSTAG